MGLYFNPSNEKFMKDISSSIYVDKTGLIKELNKVLCTNDKCVAVSHARRFGKTYVADMLQAYYSVGCDSKDIFSKYEIAQADDFAKYLNKYNVIHIDVSSFSDYAGADVVESVIQALIDDLQREYPDIDYDSPFHMILNDIYKKSGNQFVIIIDEWDYIIRNHSDQSESVAKYMRFLHSIFKSMEANTFLALGYVTGLLPIKVLNVGSGPNNFRERTMMDSKNIARYYGFTEEEVKVLCKEYDMPFDDIKIWYNGYLINGLHMYNPYSVCQAMTERSLYPYCISTIVPEIIDRCAALESEDLQDDIAKILAGEPVTVNTGTFRNDLCDINFRDDALTALVYWGYLGFKKRSDNYGVVYVPNYEVRHALLNNIS